MMSQLIEIVLVWIQFTLVFNYAIIIFVYFKWIKYLRFWIIILVIVIKWYFIIICYCKIEFVIIIYVIKRKNVFITYSATPKCSSLNSSKFIALERVQFLCTFRWQQLQCIKYEWFRIFLSQMGQVLFRSSMMIYESLQYICSQKNIALVADVGYNIGYLIQWPKGFL